jgi:fatty acid desaturase
MLWWLPAFTYYSLIIRIRNIAEHCVTPGNTDLDNTRTTRASFLIRFLLAPHRVNYHLEHHLFMVCPWYNLPKAHSMMIENGYQDKMCLEESYRNVLSKAVSA